MQCETVLTLEEKEMPAKTYTNREERKERAKDNQKERDNQTVPIASSTELVDDSNRSLYSQLFRRKWRLTQVGLYIDGLEGTLPELAIAIEDELSKQENLYPIKKGMNEIPNDLIVKADSLLKVYFVGGDGFKLYDVHFAGTLIR